MQLKKIQMTILSASLTALMCSSVTQASDLQIYAMPTAGQKTIVMMVDVSGIVKILYYSYRIRKKLEITHRLNRSTILYAYV